MSRKLKIENSGISVQRCWNVFGMRDVRTHGGKQPQNNVNLKIMSK